MKEKWNEIAKLLTRADSEFTDFINSNTLSPIEVKKLKKFIGSWNLLKKEAVNFDKYLVPVTAEEVKLPFASEAFERMWKRWIEYLSEQHGVTVESRSEISALEHLVDISGNNENNAIYYLRYAMSMRYKNFFKVDEAKKSEPAKEETVGNSSFG